MSHLQDEIGKIPCSKQFRVSMQCVAVSTWIVLAAAKKQSSSSAGALPSNKK